jgi:hypothetical protein
MAGRASAQEQSPTRPTGRGQTMQELRGGGRRPGQAEVAVEQQRRVGWRQRVGADVGVHPVAQPERPGEAEGHERPVQPDGGQAATLQEPGMPGRPAADVEHRSLDQVEQRPFLGGDGCEVRGQVVGEPATGHDPEPDGRTPAGGEVHHGRA